MNRMKTKLPWLLAGLPLLGAIYAGCGSSGNTNSNFAGDSGNGASSGSGNGGNGASSGSPGSSSGNGGDDGPTSNSGD